MRPVFALLEQNSDNFLWDFGRIKQGEVVNHDFTFKNTGKGILNIKDFARGKKQIIIQLIILKCSNFFKGGLLRC